jgi:hypothetical protein
MSTNIISLAAQDVWQESKNQQHQLGALGETPDGRLFRYAKMGEAITMSYATQAKAIDTAHVKQAVTSAAVIGAKKIVFTHGATTTAVNSLNEGFAIISYGTGIGQTLKIASNPVYTTGQTLREVYLEDPLLVALDTTSKLDFAQNPWNGVLMDTSLVTTPTGIAMRSFTSGYYGWLLTRGVVGAFSGANATAAGYSFGLSATSGCIDVTANDLTQFELGNAIQATEENYAHPVYVRID